MIRTPHYFEDWSDVVAFRDRLWAELQAGRMTRVNYRLRVRKLCKQFRKQCEAQAYYRRVAQEKAQAAGAGL